MSFITLKCKNCGSSMTLNTESNSATCSHCGSTFLIADLLDEKDIAFTKNFTAKDLEQKILASDSIKQGETCIFQANYEKAEESFKKAIELDPENFRGYLGVVKAKTHNLNTIPDDDDYVQYARVAIDLTTGDERVFVESELAKLDLLEREHRRAVKQEQQKQKEAQISQAQKKLLSKIATIFVICALAVLVAAIIATSVLSNKFLGTSLRSKVTVSSYEELSEILSDNKYLNYEIILDADIDCENNTLSPYGSSNAFTGILHGNKHKISNLVIECNNTDSCFGLFGKTSKAKIYDVIFDNIKIEQTSETYTSDTVYYGIVAGKAESTIINNVDVRNNCQIILNNNYASSVMVGGLVGAMSNYSTISNVSCHTQINSTLTTASGSGNVCVGGVVGDLASTIIMSCCSNSAIQAYVINNDTTTYIKFGIAGLIGNLNSNSSPIHTSTTKHCFFSGTITANYSRASCSVAAIAKDGQSSLVDCHNYCLYTSTSFSKNSTPLTSSQLSDYSSNNNFVKFETSDTNYQSKLAEQFDSTTWDLTNPQMPMLKVA